MSAGAFAASFTEEVLAHSHDPRIRPLIEAHAVTTEEDRKLVVASTLVTFNGQGSPAYGDIVYKKGFDQALFDSFEGLNSPTTTRLEQKRCDHGQATLVYAIFKNSIPLSIDYEGVPVVSDAAQPGPAASLVYVDDAWLPPFTLYADLEERSPALSHRRVLDLPADGVPVRKGVSEIICKIGTALPPNEPSEKDLRHSTTFDTKDGLVTKYDYTDKAGLAWTFYKNAASGTFGIARFFAWADELLVERLFEIKVTAFKTAGGSLVAISRVSTAQLSSKTTLVEKIANFTYANGTLGTIVLKPMAGGYGLAIELSKASSLPQATETK